MVGPRKQASIHTHMCNEVMLVWGWLRLTAISVQLYSSYVIHLSDDYSETVIKKLNCTAGRAFWSLLSNATLLALCKWLKLDAGYSPTGKKQYAAIQ